MKERLVTFALACAALAVFWFVMLPKQPPASEQVTRPLSVERGPNGYAALHAWLTGADIPTRSFRERYTHLKNTASEHGASGHVLITTAPHVYPIRASEVRPLRDWIAAGNTLLVLAGLSDTPDWSVGVAADPQFLENLRLMTGLRFELAQDAAPEPIAGDAQATEQEVEREDTLELIEELARPQEFRATVNDAHPLTRGVHELIAVSEFSSSKWRTQPADSAVALELAHEQPGQPVLWLTAHGRGVVIVAAYGSLLTNKVIGRSDNAQLLANIVQATRAPQGLVLIDDAHQGLVAFYDPEAFFGDERLHTTLWLLLALWLVFVLGSLRLRPATERWRPVDLTTFVRATGGFLARVLRPSAAAGRLFANFFDELRRRLGLPLNGLPLWEWLQAQGRIGQDELAALMNLYERTSRAQRVDLIELQNRLVRARENLR